MSIQYESQLAERLSLLGKIFPPLKKSFGLIKQPQLHRKWLLPTLPYWLLEDKINFIVQASATKGEGLDESMDWLSNSLQNRKWKCNRLSSNRLIYRFATQAEVSQTWLYNVYYFCILGVVLKHLNSSIFILFFIIMLDLLFTKGSCLIDKQQK